MNNRAEILRQNLEALDAKILNGDILGAVETHFHPDVETREGNSDEVIKGKAAKKAHLETFFSGIAKVNAIELHSQAVGDDVTMSEFTFDLTKTDGDRILWNEILHRRWENGTVINERYYTAG